MTEQKREGEGRFQHPVLSGDEEGDRTVPSIYYTGERAKTENGVDCQVKPSINSVISCPSQSSSYLAAAAGREDAGVRLTESKGGRLRAVAVRCRSCFPWGTLPRQDGGTGVRQRNHQTIATVPRADPGPPCPALPFHAPPCLVGRMGTRGFKNAFPEPVTK